eukprot:403330694
MENDTKISQNTGSQQQVYHTQPHIDDSVKENDEEDSRNHIQAVEIKTELARSATSKYLPKKLWRFLPAKIKEKEEDINAQRRNSQVLPIEDFLDEKNMPENINDLDEEQIEKLESLVFPDKSQREYQHTTFRYKDQDLEAVHQMSYMGPTENYAPQKGVFRKSVSRTESGINEHFSDMQVNMILSVLQITLDLYHIKKEVQANQVYQMLNSQQLTLYKEQLECKFIDKINPVVLKRPKSRQLDSRKNSLDSSSHHNHNCSNDQLSFGLQNISTNQMYLDLGHYPLKYWQNKQENKNGTDKANKFQMMYIAPKNSENMFVVKTDNQTLKYKVEKQHQNLDLVHTSGLDIFEFENSITRINQVIRPFKLRQRKFDRIIWTFTILAFLLVILLSTLFGFLVSYVISIILIILYMFATIGVTLYINKQIRSLQLRIQFNLALILKNENEGFLGGFGLIARPGYHAKWIEFHLSHHQNPFMESFERIIPIKYD